MALLGLSGARLRTETAVTNIPPNTIMRAPGDFQGALFTEAAIELAAKYIKFKYCL